MEKKFTTSDVCRLCDRLEDFGRKIGKDTKEMLADDIIAVYKYAGEIGIRDKYDDGDDDREEILKDLATRPKKVLEVIEMLGMDYFDYERSQRAA